MNRKTSAINSLALLFVLSFLGGCAGPAQPSSSGVGNNRMASPLTRTEASHNEYEISVFEIPAIPEMMTSIRNILMNDDQYYICTYSCNEDLSDENTDIYCVDRSGGLQYSIELDGFQVPDCFIDGHLSFLAANKTVVMMDDQTGDLYRTLDIDFPDVSAIAQCDGGFVAVGPGKIIKYTADGEETGRIENGEFSCFDHLYPYFEEDGVSYAVLDTDGQCEYWRLDFDAGSCEFITDSETADVPQMSCCGNYIIDGQGSSRIDLNDLQLTQIADWNENNVMPERYALYTQPRYYQFDDDDMAKTYEYRDGSCDVLLYRCTGTVDLSDQITITVGGYGSTSDLSVRMAAYLFNSSHEDFRVQLVDYSEDYPFSSGPDAQERIAELYSYFNEGNAPDIFYGNYFDYISMGQAGMVEDLTPYAEADPDFDISGLFPSIRDIMFRPGEPCYEIFSSYTLAGYWGSAEEFADSDVSISELLDNHGDITLWGATCSTDIADAAIRYPIMRSIDRTDVFSEDELESIVDFSIGHGIPTASWGDVVFNSFDTVADNEYLLTNQIINDVYSFGNGVHGLDSGFRYIGYPTTDGSTHPVTPYGMVAMSSGTGYPDACWEFMRYLLDEDVQMLIAANQNTPVDQNVLDTVLEYAQHPDELADCPATLRPLYAGRNAVSSDRILEYREALESVDTVVLFDWGLYNIICDEIDSHDLQGKPSDQIAGSLYSRLQTYIQEYQV